LDPRTCDAAALLLNSSGYAHISSGKGSCASLLVAKEAVVYNPALMKQDAVACIEATQRPY
jgi:hypothetical protein